MKLHKVRCKSMVNMPVFLFAEDGKRADIPGMEEWEGELDDTQHEQLMQNAAMNNIVIVEQTKAGKKNGSIRD